MSRHLTERSIDHVVLERGEVANSWRTQRWDSLRLLTPNWQTRLPGADYAGDDPDGFMTMPELIDFIGSYAMASSAPVKTGTTVTSVSAAGDGYTVTTDDGEWQCRTVVLASGGCNIPTVPAVSDGVPESITTCTPFQYHNPGDLPEGGVLVVGASATGVQLADEIHRSGRPVTLSVGEHVRMERDYRGRDILWWLDRIGRLDERYDEVDDLNRARHIPSPQLVGTPERTTLDLNALTDNGIELVGRFAGIRDGKAMFSGGLRNLCLHADLKLGRLLDAIDEWASENGMDDEVPEALRPERTRVPDSPPIGLDLTNGKIRSILWATGFRPDYSWLDVPVFDRKGRLRHDGGVVDSPGMYALGLMYLRRHKSSFIHGADDDTRELCAHLADYLDGTARTR